jgi:BCCT family betaine/carnitine transporter
LKTKTDAAVPGYQPKLDTHVFSISLLALLVISSLLMIWPEATTFWALNAMAWVTNHFGWAYLLTGVLPLAFAGWLAFGRFGHVLLGNPGEPPEYSNVHWVAMMFTASMGASLIAWGFAEPIFYLATPPLGIEPNSTQAFEFAHMYPLFHWGVVPWAIYCLSVIFYATTFDSAAYTLASICTHDLPSDQEPAAINRVAWAMGLGVMAIGLMVAGGIETIKAMSVVSAFIKW